MELGLPGNQTTSKTLETDFIFRLGNELKPNSKETVLIKKIFSFNLNSLEPLTLFEKHAYDNEKIGCSIQDFTDLQEESTLKSKFV